METEFNARANKLLRSFLPYFLNDRDKNYYKMNAELIFASIFCKHRSKDIRQSIKQFISGISQNRLKDLDPATILLIKAYGKEQNVFDNTVSDYEVRVNKKFKFTVLELGTYKRIIREDFSDETNMFLLSEDFNCICHDVLNRDELYYITHRIMYLSYLNKCPNYLRGLKNSVRMLIKDRLMTYALVCMMKEDYDLLGELLISYLLLSTKEDRVEDRAFLDKSLYFLDDFMKALEQEHKKADNEKLADYYHTVLVMYMIKELVSCE